MAAEVLCLHGIVQGWKEEEVGGRSLYPPNRNGRG